MFARGQAIVVGVSGGPDSAALLHALAGLREEWRLTLVACHVNHGFRGAEAEGDAAYVRSLCERLDVACHVENVDVPAMRKRRHLSAQQAARDARHVILRRVMADVGADRIALAHTRDDRAESVLLNAIRGSGLEGLSGFAPTNLPLVRPFYDVSRAQVERYCTSHALDPRQDSSNLKTEYHRNRVRLDLLPYLREHFNLRADDSLLRLADLARDDNAFLDQMAADVLAMFLLPTFELLKEVSTDDHLIQPPIYPQEAKLKEAKLTFAARDLNAYPVALRRRILRQAILRQRGHLQDIGFETIESALAAIEQGRAHSVELPAAESGIFHLSCADGEITVRKANAPQTALAWQTLVQIPGQTHVPQAGVTITAAFYAPKRLAARLEAWRQQGSLSEAILHPGGRNAAPEGKRDVTRVVLLAWRRSDVSLPLLVRSWQAGDRMRPQGLRGAKKLQDIFVDAKIPASLRMRVPVLAEAGENGRILAAGDVRAGENAAFVVHLPQRLDALLSLVEWLSRHENSYQELLAVTFEYE